MEGREPLTPWVKDFRHSIAVIGSEPLDQQSTYTPEAGSKGPLVFPGSLVPGVPVAYQRYSFMEIPHQQLPQKQHHGQAHRQDRPWSIVEYSPYRATHSAARAQDASIRRRPVSSMPITTSSTPFDRRPIASALAPKPPSLSLPRNCELLHNQSTASQDVAHQPAAGPHTLPVPQPDVPHASLAQIAINNAKTMSLRRFVHWVVSQPEVHSLQSINHTQAKNTQKPSTLAIIVLRNLIILEEMYRPGRVMLPSPELYHIVQVIHGELQHLRRIMEEAVEQIHHNSHSMDATQFITWLSYHFTVCGRRFSIPKPGFFYNPDSLTSQQRLIDRAIEFYRHPDVLHDRTLTNALKDLILRAVLGYRDEAYRDDGNYKPHAQRQAERKAARERAKQSSPGADRLLFHHDTPR